MGLMIYLFFGVLFLLFKWHRFIFILISFEFLLMEIFFSISLFSYFGILFWFLVMGVVSSVFGVTLFVTMSKGFGSDKCLL